MSTDTELAPNVADAIGRIIVGSDDPYPDYALLREHAPRLRLPDGTRVLTRRADIVAVLRDSRFGHLCADRQRRLWGDDQVNASRLLQSRLRWFLFMDPPDHGRLRGLVQKVFTPKAFEDRAPTIQGYVDEHLDRALASDTFDLVSDFAHPLTVDTIGDLLGVPRADRARFSDWGLVFEALPGSDAFKQAERLIIDYEDYFTALLAEKRRSPGDDLLSALLTAEEHGDRLSADEALATAFFSVRGRVRHHAASHRQRRPRLAAPPRPADATPRPSRSHAQRRRGVPALRRLSAVHHPHCTAGRRRRR